MSKVQFCTQEWLDQCAQNYNESPDLQKLLKTLTVKMSYRVKSEPELGFENSVIFCTFFEKGTLTKACFLSEEQAIDKSEFLVAAPASRWMSLLRKKSKFAVDFALGKVKLEIGSKVGVLAVAPYAGYVVNMLSHGELQYPDEMTSGELAEYSQTIETLRESLG